MAIPWYSSEFSPDPPNHINFELHSMERPSTNTVPTKDTHTSVLSSAFHTFVLKFNNVFKNETTPFSVKALDNEEFRDATDVDDYGGHNLYHSGAINRAFFPMKMALMAVGRWPYRMSLQSVSCKKGRRRNELEFPVDEYRYPRRSQHLAKVNNYDPSLWSPLWITFGLTTAFTLFVLIMSTLSFFDFFLEWKLLPGNHWKSLEKNIFHENLVVFLVVWGCLLHTTVSSFSMFFNRKRIVKILNFWNVAADELLFDEIIPHRRFLIVSNLAYVLFLVLIYFAFWNIQLIKDGAKLFGILALRPIYPEEKGQELEEWKLCVFGIITILYAIYASRALLIIFCFKCRVLRNMFRSWNGRLIAFLRKPDINPNAREKVETTELLEELECRQLLKDMTILLKLVKQMDKVFATVLQAYYGVQLLNMCFELYMLAKSGSDEFTRTKDPLSKKLEIITAVLTLCQNVYFFFAVSLDGSYVGEEAAKGQEALRRFHVTPKCNRQKKYLVYNLTLIYNQPIVLTGGKYFTINRPFIITVLGAVLTYFVIIMQVEPSLRRAGGNETHG